MDGAANPNSELLDGWLTRAELAAELGMAADTLRRWATKRIGPPHVRMGQRVLYRKDAVREWRRDHPAFTAALRAAAAIEGDGIPLPD
ncbi:MAG TPA: helix-turn-helix domain-containing protein [Amaricoccus sp.]|uniref:helix-turn-helix transcriptional regulator n=1 Tax=Amaricoccus sp. TaxID=1872485 RepID=UPI002B84A8D3|nr:helix-turn-helix domain-containing protein [Amaricoccus sp.]HMQ92847.1 helix-turn-helix domain-containing protein [Amaricoccus sp.]HMR37049.1 helix-turn-helix domain-containing protein [Paracoccus sp. (in: a-proteobacteria)]HMR54167.1 helix-turn-helix domain-containing protein [Amaricoccus sp.]HMU01204.1 helix-turn-helix domain-containing protein [Amaricoccus sp.]